MIEGEVPRTEPGDAPATPRPGGRDDGGGSGGGTLLLMLVPVAAYIYPPLYQRVDPRLAGIPFAIWYQFAWVLVGVAVTGFAYWWQDLRRRDAGVRDRGEGR